jgi:hypothetical protein
VADSPAAALHVWTGSAWVSGLGTAEGLTKVQLSQGPADLSSLVIDRLRNGGSADMVVDGSGAAVSFTFDADGTDDLFLDHLKIVFVPNVIKFKATTFGAMPALTNGVEVSVTSGGTKTVLGLIKISEDFLFLGGEQLETGLGENDLLTLLIGFGGVVKLDGGSADKVEVKIQDDVTSQGANSTKYFQAEVRSKKMI